MKDIVEVLDLAVQLNCAFCCYVYIRTTEHVKRLCLEIVLDVVLVVIASVRLCDHSDVSAEERTLTRLGVHFITHDSQLKIKGI